MGRKQRRPPADTQHDLATCQPHGWTCGAPLGVASTKRRPLMPLAGLIRLHLPVRRCRHPACLRYHGPDRPEAEGAQALPRGECGLDVIALSGSLRFAQHRSVSAICTALKQRGVAIGERSVTQPLQRYEELLALRLADHQRLSALLTQQGLVVLALDGRQPDVGHEVLHPEGTRLRDCVSGEILLARSLRGATEADLVPLMTEVRDALRVPFRGVSADGQQSSRKAVASARPDVPHHLCQFHELREAAKPIDEADRPAKQELQKAVRAVRPSERWQRGRMRTPTRGGATVWPCGVPYRMTAAHHGVLQG